MTSKIYVFGNERWGNDYLGFAMAEDGSVLGSHLSSNEEWLASDLGATSDRNHEAYADHYPDGFEVEYIPFDNVEKHEGLIEAVKRNAERAAKEAEVCE